MPVKTPPWPPMSLKKALVLSIVILVVASGAVISQIVIHRYGTILQERAVAQAENIAHKLALDAADKILINDMVSLQKLLDDQLVSTPAIGYLFVVKNDRVLTHTFGGGIPAGLIPANPPAENGTPRIQKILSEKGKRYIDIAWPIFDGHAGTLRLGLSEAPIRKEATQLWIQVSLFTLVVVILAILVSVYFVDRLTRPLLSLAGTAEKIDAGNLDVRVNVQGRAEVSRLERAFNGMLDRLRENTLRLEESYLRLEEKNRALDRAHRQLTTSFNISREMGALTDTQGVCTYLVATLKAIADCRSMAMLLFSSDRKDAFVYTDQTGVRLAPDQAETAAALLDLRGNRRFFDAPDTLRFSFLPMEIQGFSRLSVFSIRHMEHLLGAVIIGCPKDCRCVEKELEIIEMILEQTSGVLNRVQIQEEELQNLKRQSAAGSRFGGIVGRDAAMQVIFQLIEDVAPTDATVLIQGESGTGKELVARAIHAKSPRADKPFVVINCAAYPSTLLESELFGHEKGAFTGALRRKTGRFEQADGGTVFLDEIGEIPKSAQIKLLRVLQSQRFERVGAEESISVNVRVLAATHKNLMQEIKEGQFREDLFYRLNVVPVLLPELRNRRNDIPLLAAHFLEKFAAEQGKSIRGFSPAAMRRLLNYAWPGNVRELENSIEHAVVLAKGSQIEPSDLPETIHAPRPQAQEKKEKPKPTLSDNEASLVRQTLEECSWNKTEAAARLGISRSTLYEKLKKYNITSPTFH
ncbi:MAG: sigma 54-interacting transcriptional regulator [Deltaproteobacteria bacterium]|nr:sigma 54-interacting transcriptional regulator [Deltaproteobacteria bacterium]MBW2043053.1 sigma 54-interacting transcriptional regulator [Deltaproteobacteria bacterium]